MNWRLMYHTAGDQPQQHFDKDGNEVFLAGAQRVSGPDDATMPRRLIGTGSTRAQATRSLLDALRTYDHRHRIVS